MRHTKLDRFDRDLLNLVQREGDLTTQELGDRVGLSASAVQRRLKRLRTQGVITATTMLVDPERIGHSSFFVTGLEVERERPELLARLRAWLRREEVVQEAFYATGTPDFIIIVNARSPAAYDEFMGRLLEENTNVRKFTTSVVLQVIKRSLAVSACD